MVEQSIHPSFTQLINDSFAHAFEAWGISFPDDNFLYLCYQWGSAALSKAEPSKRGGWTAWTAGCLHHPHTSQWSRGTPYMVQQKPWRMAFSRAHACPRGHVGMEVGRKGTTKKVMLALAFHTLKELRIVVPLFGVIAKYYAGMACFKHPPPLHTKPSKGNGLFIYLCRTFPWCHLTFKEQVFRLHLLKSVCDVFRPLNFSWGLCFL